VEQFSPTHLVPLAITACAALWLALWARRRPPDARELVLARRGLAAAMVATEVPLRVAVHAIDGVRPAANLPLHLTHAAWIVCVIALWTARPIAFELAYFWGLAAVLQALVTPSLNRDFPDLRYWEFMAVHVPVIVGVVLLAWGCRMTPRPGAVARAWLAGGAVFAVASLASLVTGGNYMFSRRPPPKGSLLDLMGPWPWYLIAAALLAFAVFWLLDRLFDRRRAAAITG
jgi:hypothetical integral membrane protein (TIGR02206 family)